MVYIMLLVRLTTYNNGHLDSVHTGYDIKFVNYCSNSTRRLRRTSTMSSTVLVATVYCPQ